jgi:hypothetical protein
MKSLGLLATGALLGAALLGGCGAGAQVASVWNDAPVVIDGSASEWNGRLTPIKDAGVSLGIRNDADNLYLCMLMPEEQFRRQMMLQGLTVLFETQDGRRLGVQYPVGLMHQDRAMMPMDRDMGPEDRDRLFDMALRELEIRGSEPDDRTVFSTLQTPGFKVKIGRADGMVAYELEMPLAATKSNPYAIGAGPGASVRLEIASGSFGTARSGRGADDHQPGMGRQGGGMRPGATGMPGGEMPGETGMPGEGNPDAGMRPGRNFGGRMSPLDYKANVTLSTSIRKP